MTVLADALDALPKVELHCHVEGTMRPATVVELARERGGPADRRPDRALPLRLPRRVPAGVLAGAVDARASGATGRGWRTRASSTAPARRGLPGDVLHAGPAPRGRPGPRRHRRRARRGHSAAEAETGARVMLVGDMDRAFGPAAGLEFVERLVELRRPGDRGAERVIGVGMDSTELGIDPVTFLPAYGGAAAAGFRLTAHQGENSPASAIAACLEVLGARAHRPRPAGAGRSRAGGTDGRGADPDDRLPDLERADRQLVRRGWRTTATRGCAQPGCWPRSTPTTRR